MRARNGQTLQNASKKLRLNPTIIDLIFWRSCFQMRARNRVQTLQIATKIGLYTNDRKYERSNSRTPCYKMLQVFALAGSSLRLKDVVNSPTNRMPPTRRRNKTLQIATNFRFCRKRQQYREQLDHEQRFDDFADDDR